MMNKKNGKKITRTFSREYNIRNQGEDYVCNNFIRTEHTLTNNFICICVKQKMGGPTSSAHTDRHYGKSVILRGITDFPKNHWSVEIYFFKVNKQFFLINRASHFFLKASKASRGRQSGEPETSVFNILGKALISRGFLRTPKTLLSGWPYR